MKKKDINKWDAKWSKAVKERAGYRCEYCGTKGKGLNSHHLFSRRHMVIRYNLGNGISLCVGCHFIAHQSPLPFGVWVIKKRGKTWYDNLQKLSKKLAKDCPNEIGKDLDKIEEVLSGIHEEGLSGVLEL